MSYPHIFIFLLLLLLLSVHCVVSVYWKLIQSRNKFFMYANILDNKTFSDSEDHFGQAGEPVNNLSLFKVFFMVF